MSFFSSLDTVDDPIFTPGCLRAMAALVADASEHCNPALSPLYGEFGDLPTMLLQVGELEGLRDDTIRVAGHVQAAGGEATLAILPGLPHIWPWFVPDAPESTEAYRTIGKFLAGLEERSLRE